MLWWTLRKLKSSAAEDRIAAAEELGNARENKAVPALIERLEDESDAVRLSSARALGKIGHPASVGALALALKACRKNAGGGKGTDQVPPSQVLAEALAGAGAAAVGDLIKLLEVEDRDVRRWAVHALGLTRDPRAVEPLCRKLEDSRSEVRRTAIQALADTGQTAALPALIRSVAHKDPETRQAAARALGILADPAAADALAAAVRDSNEGVQLSALASLGRIGGSQAISVLSYALESGRKSLREAASALLVPGALAVNSAADRAALAIAAMDFGRAEAEGAAAVNPLIDALGSRDAGKRLKAAQALGRLQDGKCIAALLRLLKDHDAQVRGCVAEVLGDFGSQAENGLGEQLRSYDPVVQCLAAKALARNGGESAVSALADFAAELKIDVAGTQGPTALAAAVASALNSDGNRLPADDQD
jgi:HEAT repeat protein